MTANKGEFRGYYVALIDSPEFQALPADARSVFWPLKLALGKAGIDVFYPEVLPRYTGLSFERVSEGLQALQDDDWLRVEKNVFWIRNGLRFDPSNPLRSPNQKKGIEEHLATLPKLSLVNEFAKYYDLTEPFADLRQKRNPSERVEKPLRSTEDGRRKTETEDGDGNYGAQERAGLSQPGAAGDEGQGDDEPDPPMEFIHPTQRMSQSEVLQAWVNAQTSHVSSSDRAKMKPYARRIADNHTKEQVMKAFIGIGLLYPHSAGQPWDLSDLERKFVKAEEAAKDHPDIKQARDEADFDEEIRKRGYGT